jgi:hypothetical protein
VRVRPARTDDLPEVIRMGKAFFEKSAYKGIGFDEASCVELFNKLVVSDDALLLIAEQDSPVGMIGALRYPFYMNNSHLTVQELFWWVDEDARGTRAGLSLIAGIESWATESGAKSVQMMCLDSLEPERIGNLYKRRHYKASDHSYIKVME